MEQVLSEFTAILRDVFDDDELVARADLSAQDVDGWDSLSNLRLMMSVEKHFQVKFSAAEIGKLNNLGELAALIGTKKQG